MASFIFNGMQQHYLISLSLSRYHSTLNSRFFSHFLTSSPLKTTFQRKVTHNLVFTAHASVPKVSTIENDTSTNPINFKDTTESGTGYSSVNSIDERVSEKFVKKHVNSVVEEVEVEVEEEEEAERRFSRNNWKTLGYRERRGISSRSFKGNDTTGKSLEAKASSRYTVSERMKDNENLVGKWNKKKKTKKDKDSPEVKLRVALDMCSKRGDVMGAISLYDSARREGVKLGQHHYTVLLYLCSSAAVGLVRPAKSGCDARTLNALASSNEVVKHEEFIESIDKNDKCFSNTMLDSSVSLNGQLVDTAKSHKTFDNAENSVLDSEASASVFFQSKETHMDSHSAKKSEKSETNPFTNEFSFVKDVASSQKDHGILVSDDVKKYALQKGFEIYENMHLDKVPMNEAAFTSVGRMAMSMGDGDMAFEMVKQMKILGINPRLRSYGPALSTFCNNGEIDKAFVVEKHMLEHGVYPEEPELEALLRVSIGAGKSDKVYYLLHKLRNNVRKVSPPTSDLIIDWFKSKQASKVGKRKWDKTLIKEAIENNGGGWHGQGWLGTGKWEVCDTTIGNDGMCKCCGVHLVTIDLDPIETENFAKSVASIAIMREKKSNFQNFQKWLDYYGPFEAVVDAANVGLFSQRRFQPSKISAVVNGIRQKLPSKKFPLIILHNKRIKGDKMDDPINRALIDRWKNADALYATPTGSNDDWYWLYAAIKFKCLLVTNDEMRDHLFQLLGNDFFPKWKERHQVHFSFSDTGPEFHMPPPCSVVIQESEEGHWHIPVKSEHDFESERWLCITRAKLDIIRQHSSTKSEDSKPLQNGDCATPAPTTASTQELQHMDLGNHEGKRETPQEMYKNLRNIFSAQVSSDSNSILSEIEAAELIGGCTIDFQI